MKSKVEMMAEEVGKLSVDSLNSPEHIAEVAALDMARMLLGQIEKWMEQDKPLFWGEYENAGSLYKHIKSLFEFGECDEHYWANVLHDDHVKCTKCGKTELK